MTYPDLQHEVADRVRPPGFDEVLVRAAAARRRRRTTMASGVAAAVVVGGLAFAVDVPERSSPEPAGRTPWDGTSEIDPRLPAAVREVLEADDAHPLGISGSGDDMAVVWRTCGDSSECRVAVVARAGDQVTGHPLPDDDVMIATVPGGWLLDDGERYRRLTPAGDLEIVGDPGAPPAGVEAGDTAVPTSGGLRLLRGDALLPLPGPRTAISAYVTPDGTLVAVLRREGRVAVSVTPDGRSWATTPVEVGTPAVHGHVVGHGDSVAVVLLGEQDGSSPVVGVQVSQDGGASWLAARLDVGRGGAPKNPSAVAVSPVGSTYVTTESGLLRIAADGTTTTERRSPYAASVLTVGDEVCLVVDTGRVGELRCSSDDGRTWEPAPLPGFR